MLMNHRSNNGREALASSLRWHWSQNEEMLGGNHWRNKWRQQEALASVGGGTGQWSEEMLEDPPGAMNRRPPLWRHPGRPSEAAPGAAVECGDAGGTTEHNRRQGHRRHQRLSEAGTEPRSEWRCWRKTTGARRWGHREALARQSEVHWKPRSEEMLRNHWSNNRRLGHRRHWRV
jgi:hypothetical protein